MFPQVPAPGPPAWTGPAVPPQVGSYPPAQPVPNAYPPNFPAQTLGPPAPTNYAWSYPTPYWDGDQPRWNNSPEMVPHTHTNTGAVYGRNGYGRNRGYAAPNRYMGYDDPRSSGPPSGSPMGSSSLGMPMSGSPMGPPSMSPPGGGGNVLEELYNGLSHLTQILAQALGSGPAGPSAAPMPPDTPFPRSGQPMMAGRYDRSVATRPPSRSSPSYPPSRSYRRYEDGRSPTTYDGPRTISGLPVGYQMKVDKLEAENRRLVEAMNVVMYERDVADSQACAAEIGKLAQAGYNVGEYEVQELKKKNPQDRAVFIQRIMTTYQRIGTEPLPMMPGDPTPGPAPAVAPLSQEQMQQVLSMLPPGATHVQYAQAVRAVQYGQVPVQHGPFGPGSPFNNPEPLVPSGPIGSFAPNNHAQPSERGNSHFPGY